MKLLLAAMFIALLMAGCGEVQEEEAIDWDDNETRDKIIAEAIDWEKIQHRIKEEGGFSEALSYAPNEQTPYTGWAKWMDDNGQIEHLYQLKDGTVVRLTSFNSNGQKKSESTHKDGKLMTMVVWKPNGEKCPVTNIKDGNGIKVWHKEDGTEGGPGTYKDGERVRNYRTPSAPPP